ncbi:vitamin K epoxide reductase family protein [Sorangium sp. So ce131]|uniref:vitamin K epoxide reductase family protein n=1 Tax=Sorangium sp. So ce131 TaxID=3133282 RepID=UPI003F5F469D
MIPARTRDLLAPADGPAEVLAEVARRRRIRCSRRHARELVARHAHPGSLLALVDAARSLGLSATAGQGALDVLDEAEPGELPAVLHFDAGPHGGFGLLEEVTAAGYRLWDSQQGSRAIARDELAAMWSGVVVFLEKSGETAAPSAERGYLGRRVRELLFEQWRLRLDLAGPRTSPDVRAVRAALAAAALALLALAALRQPAALQAGFAATAALAAAGFAAMFAALAWTPGSGPPPLCGARGGAGCESVLLSEYAAIAGVPLSGLGLAFFGAILLGLASAALSASAAPLWTAGASLCLALPASAALVAAQARGRHACALCMTAHGATAAGAAVFAWLALSGALPAPPARDVAAAALAQALFFGLLLSSTVPHVAHAADLDALRRRFRRLAGSPLASLAALAAEPRLPIDGAAAGVLVGDAAAPHAVVALAHPSCHLCGPALDELAALVERHPGLVRAHVGVAPRDPADPADRALCEALAAIGVARGGAALLAAFRAAKRDLPRLLSGDPAAALGGELGLDAAEIARARAGALALVGGAGALKDRYADGFPAIFFDGRRCEAPLRHVDAWCARPALLEELPPARGGLEESVKEDAP